MDEYEIARCTIAKLTAVHARLEPALRIAGREYTVAQLARMNVAELWGEDMARYAGNFITCIRKQRSAMSPRRVMICRDNAEGEYPDDLQIVEAAGWQVTELIVTYPDELTDQ